ncbi:MAG: hypothetical protein L0219_11435 [Phycisphaerales bacterium]|nr:hypothetical protein [Phycisphaerales bacterium]
MRVLEILLLATLLPAVIGLFLPAHRRPRWRHYLHILGVVLIVLHLVIEGYRWQMIPAYALTGIFLLASLRGLTRRVPNSPRASRWRAALRIAGAAVVLIVFGSVVLTRLCCPSSNCRNPPVIFASARRDSH